jgi:hypothetical protein
MSTEALAGALTVTGEADRSQFEDDLAYHIWNSHCRSVRDQADCFDFVEICPSILHGNAIQIVWVVGGRSQVLLWTWGPKHLCANLWQSTEWFAEGQYRFCWPTQKFYP